MIPCARCGGALLAHDELDEVDRVVVELRCINCSYSPSDGRRAPTAAERGNQQGRRGEGRQDRRPRRLPLTRGAA